MKGQSMKKDEGKSDLQASFNIIRVGQQYSLTNFGEIYTFQVVEILSNENCMVRSLDTLETYQLNDLVKFGRGGDFNFQEL